MILKPRDAAGASGTFRAGDHGELAARGARQRPRRRRAGGDRGVRRGPRGLLRHADGGRPRRLRLHQPLLPERARGDAHPLDLAADRRDQPHPRAGLRRGQGHGRAGDRGARHRHLGDPHGVVLRPEGAEASPRSAAARRGSASGTATAPATSSTSTANGRSRSATASPTGRRRAATPAASSRCARTGTAGIAGYEGTEAIFHHYRDLVVGSHFPTPGTPTQPVAAGYMANAWMRVRHPDYDELGRILGEIGERIRVHAH